MNAHLELVLGIGYLHNGSPELTLESIAVSPVISAGYRNEKKNGYVFRAGIGYPEGVYAGIGLGF